MLRQLYLLIGSLLFSVAMWVWMQAIAIPHQQTESAERGAPRGNLSDLYPRWLGARELLLHHRNPYRADVTREIQIGYYGRALDPARPNDPKDQQGFAYPIYVVLMLAPTVTLSFATVHRIAFWLFAALTAVSVPLWLRTLGWRISVMATATWIFLTLSCFPAIQGLKLQQLTVFVAFLIASSMYALSRRRYVIAGMLLALATIKPQLVFLLIAWLLLWVLGNWRERQRGVWSFLISMAILVVAGEFLLPGWITEFRVAARAYYQYTDGGRSVLDLALSTLVGRTLSALLICVFFWLTWRRRHAFEGTVVFQWTMSFVLATTLLVVPTTAPYNQLLLLPCIMMIARAVDRLRCKGRTSRFFLVVSAVVVLEQWLAALLLTAALLFLPLVTVQKAWALPIYMCPLVPVVIYAQLLLLGSDMTSGVSQELTKTQVRV